MKKGKSIIFLMVWFSWSAGQDLDMIARYSIKSDYYIFFSNGLSPLFFLFVFTIFALNITALFYLFRPFFIGFYVSLASLLVAAIQNILSIVLAMSDLTGVQKAYEMGREIRGMPIRKEAMEIIFTPSGMYSTLALMFTFYLLVLFFIIKNKTYYFGPTINA